MISSRRKFRVIIKAPEYVMSRIQCVHDKKSYLVRWSGISISFWISGRLNKTIATLLLRVYLSIVTRQPPHCGFNKNSRCFSLSFSKCLWDLHTKIVGVSIPLADLTSTAFKTFSLPVVMMTCLCPFKIQLVSRIRETFGFISTALFNYFGC